MSSSSVRDLKDKVKNHPLFISGARGTTTTNVVIPDDHFRGNLDRLRQSLEARRMSRDFDLDHLSRGFLHLDSLDADIAGLEEKVQVARDEKKGLGEGEEGESRRQELIEAIREARSKLKVLKKDKWRLEETIVAPSLELPNFVADGCPVGEDEVLLSEGTYPDFPSPARGHAEVAGDQLLFSSLVSSPPAFYLLGSLAELEMDILALAREQLLERGFFPMANPDFAKSVVVEGCGGDFTDPSATFSLRETAEYDRRQSGQAMHVVGGASLAPFTSFFSKCVLKNPELLPRSFFCAGRQYRPITAGDGEPPSLFNTQQSTAVEVFNIYAMEESDVQVLTEITTTVKQFYCSLGLPHFRLVARAADKLSRAECFRVAIEVPAPGLGEEPPYYVEVGSVSCYGDYLAKRMMLKAVDHDSSTEDNDKDLMDLRVIGGTLVDVTKLIGCLLECSQGLPKIIR